MYERFRRHTYLLFSPQAGGSLGRTVDAGIMLLIALNVTAVILATVDPLYQQYESYFYAFEAFSVTIFTIEYLARIWTATEHPDYDAPVVGRLKFALTPFLIVDLLAIIPFYLGAFFIDLRFLRILRLVRFLRVFKLARYSESLRSFGRVIREKREDLVIAVAVTIMLLLVSSSLMYYVEHTAQPEAFSSIPETFWWGVVTLTTVGYGDVYPITPLGQFLAALIAFFGIGLFALPASILASGFIEDDEDQRSEYEYCPHCGEKLE